jgi:hypothetical protein
MEPLEQHRLVAHPLHRAKSIKTVDVTIRNGGRGYYMLTYRVAPAHELTLGNTIGRKEGLWRSTCFELFVKTRGAAAYREFNFAAPGAWNVYAFSDWRVGMKVTEVADPPLLVDILADDRKRQFPEEYELDVILNGSLLPEAPISMSLTAVVEERNGTKSYWALAHPPGDPNFHHPACFKATLPPIDRP